MLRHWLKKKGERKKKCQTTKLFVSEMELWESLEMCLHSTSGISFELVGNIFIQAANQRKDHLLWNKGAQTSGYYSNSHKFIAYWY